jgi:hypothetical protein
MPVAVASVAAAGWGGDRATLFRKGEGPTASFALGWHVRFDRGPANDPDAEAKEAFRALAGRAKAPAQGAQACLERGELGPWTVVRHGRDLAITAGPYHREGARVLGESDCTHSARWAVDVAVAAPASAP